jgi:hypothetical protein
MTGVLDGAEAQINLQQSAKVMRKKSSPGYVIAANKEALLAKALKEQGERGSRPIVDGRQSQDQSSGEESEEEEVEAVAWDGHSQSGLEWGRRPSVVTASTGMDFFQERFEKRSTNIVSSATGSTVSASKKPRTIV